MYQHGHHHHRSGRPMGGLSGIIWILGIFFMIRYGWWWPGILVLIGITALLSSLWRETPPPPTTFGNPPPPPSPQASAPVAPPAPAPARPAPASPEHRVDLLPATCARCGAPMRAHEVKWTGAQSASCPYCGSTLNMTGNKGKPTPPTWNF